MSVTGKQDLHPLTGYIHGCRILLAILQPVYMLHGNQSIFDDLK